jgi:glycosyltransferase involved in cell wall biosynthesis
MAERGHQVTLVAPEGSPLLEKAAAEGLRVHPMGFSRPRMPADILRLRRFLRDIRPHVLNTHGNADTKVGLAAALGLKIPCVILSRHVTAPVRCSWYNRRLYRDLCRRVFTTSDAAARQIAGDLGLDAARILTVPSGIVPPDRLMAREAARQALAAELNRPGKTRFVGSVGRLSPEKGLEYLLEAFDGIAGRSPDHDLVLAGEGRHRAAISAQIRERGLDARVHLTGHREPLWPLLRALDVKVLASPENEGVPQSILEAMFARCPVIGTAVGGIPDIIEHQTTGLLVPPKDPAGLAAAILETLAAPAAAERRAKAAHRMAAQSHSIDAMGERILGIYRQVFSESAGPLQVL